MERSFKFDSRLIDKNFYHKLYKPLFVENFTLRAHAFSRVCKKTSIKIKELK